MRKDKIKAFELRRQQKSYAHISSQLKIPKSTLAAWFKSQDWSKDIRDRLSKEVSFSLPKKLASITKSNKARWSKLHASYRSQAEQEFVSLKKDPLFLAGIMLYWGEGDKTPNSNIKFANNDPQMVRVFYSFLKKSLLIPEEKVRAYLLLYPDLNEPMLKSFWNKATGIPLDRFWNSIVIKGRHSTKRLSYGVCNVNVSSRELKEKMLVWINLAQNELA